MPWAWLSARSSRDNKAETTRYTKLRPNAEGVILRTANPSHEGCNHVRPPIALQFRLVSALPGAGHLPCGHRGDPVGLAGLRGRSELLVSSIIVDRRGIASMFYRTAGRFSHHRPLVVPPPRICGGLPCRPGVHRQRRGRGQPLVRSRAGRHPTVRVRQDHVGVGHRVLLSRQPAGRRIGLERDIGARPAGAGPVFPGRAAARSRHGLTHSTEHVSDLCIGRDSQAHFDHHSRDRYLGHHIVDHRLPTGHVSHSCPGPHHPGAARCRPGISGPTGIRRGTGVFHPRRFTAGVLR